MGKSQGRSPLKRFRQLTMKYIAAYLMLQQGGNASPSAEDIKSVLGAVGIEADSDRLTKFLGEVEGKDINEIIAEGSSKLASVPAGGAAAAAPAAGGAAAPAEEKKEEKKKRRRRSPTTTWASV